MTVYVLNIKNKNGITYPKVFLSRDKAIKSAIQDFNQYDYDKDYKVYFEKNFKKIGYFQVPCSNLTYHLTECELTNV